MNLRPLLHALLLVVSAVCAACVGDVSGETLGAEARFYYPQRATLSADGQTLVVVNTNFDQRFRSGWLSYVDLPALVAAGDRDRDRDRDGTGAGAGAAAATPIPQPAAAHPAVRQGPKVAGLGGPLLLDRAGGRAWLAHRGAGLLTSFDVATDAAGRDVWRCSGGGDGSGNGPRAALSNRNKATDCDENHLLDVRMATASHLGLADEPERDDYLDPFALAQLGNDTLAVGFLATPAVAELSTAAKPEVRAVRRGPKRSRFTDLIGQSDGLVAAGHDDGVGAAAGQSLLLRWAAAATRPASLWPSAAMGRMPQLGERGPEVVRLLASPVNERRIFLLARRPDLVAVAEVVAPLQGQWREGEVGTVTGEAEVRLQASEVLADQALNELAYLVRPTGNLLVASSFVRDTLYFFADGQHGLTLVHRIRLGRGRGAAALVPVDVDGRSFLAVTTFFDHGFDLFDVSSANVQDFRLHARVQDVQFASTVRAH